MIRGTIIGFIVGVLGLGLITLGGLVPDLRDALAALWAEFERIIEVLRAEYERIIELLRMGERIY